MNINFFRTLNSANNQSQTPSSWTTSEKPDWGAPC